MEIVELVDGSRGRELPTHLYLPRSEPPWPLAVFGHGWTGHPRKFGRLLSTWAGAGYAAAAPAFPLTNDRAPKQVFDDVSNQPADVSFVLDELLERGEFDPTRVAVAGFSLGGITAYGAMADGRFRAAIVISGRLPAGEAPGPVPLLAVHGELDEVVPYRDGVEAYRAAGPPKALLTLHVPGHHEPIEDGWDTEADAIVPAATTAFLDLVLRGDPGGRERLVAAAAAPLASLELDGL